MAFENLKTDGKIKEAGDYIGGAQVFDSDVYKMRINIAYQGLSKSGANSLVLIFKNSDGREFKITLWVTSGTEKGGHHYWIDKNGDQQYLPGFNQANALALLTCSKELFELDTEVKVVGIYDYELKKEIPTKVEVFYELLDKEIMLGLIKQTVDKNAKGDDGKYHPTGETREDNDVDKMFHPDTGLTVTEMRAGVTQPEFLEKWTKKWKGQVKNRAKGVTQSVGVAGAAPAASGAAPSLFA